MISVEYLFSGYFVIPTANTKKKACNHKNFCLNFENHADQKTKTISFQTSPLPFTSKLELSLVSWAAFSRLFPRMVLQGSKFGTPGRFGEAGIGPVPPHSTGNRSSGISSSILAFEAASLMKISLEAVIGLSHGLMKEGPNCNQLGAI
jgi:hypothetical protein